MRVIITKDYDEVGKRAASIIVEAIGRKPHFVLGLDVSNAVIGTYKELIRSHREGSLDFSRVFTFNLDDFIYSCKRTKAPSNHTANN